MKQLTGHDSQENAYIIKNYPYGFLKTNMRIWVESKPKNGQRVCRQTLNPKTGKWNKVKKSTYEAVYILLLNEENNHLVTNGINFNTDQKTLNEFKEYTLTDFQKERLKVCQAIINSQALYTVSFGSPGDKSQQTIKEQQELVKKCVNYAYSKLD